MSYFLAKTDPETYSISDLRRDRNTTWDGVRNPQALKTIREMQSGDTVFIYHSQGEAAIVGIATVTSDARPDPTDPKLAVVDFEFASDVEPPVTLKEIKESGLFTDWSLVRQSRLSTMQAPDAFVKWFRRHRPQVRLP
jgi:predicted RNA-binding protein with PUA-like domain